MEYADIHFHGLCHVDDGAASEEEMYTMLTQAYQDGVRTLCYTPHYHPGYFKDRQEAAIDRFCNVQAYCAQRYPDLEVYLGNELRYADTCVAWLREGRCRTYNDTRYVLVDFSEWEEKRTIVQGLEQMLNAGYLPVLGHVERYRSLWRSDGDIRRLMDDGVLMQMDTQSLEGGFGYRVRLQSRHLLAKGYVDLVSSDAHDPAERAPGISRAYHYIAQKMGESCAAALCRDNARHILEGEGVRKEMYL